LLFDHICQRLILTRKTTYTRQRHRLHRGKCPSMQKVGGNVRERKTFGGKHPRGEVSGGNVLHPCNRPVDSHVRGPRKIFSRGPSHLSGEKILNFSFLNSALWCTLIFLINGETPNVAGPGVTYSSLPHPLDGLKACTADLSH